MGEMRGLSDRAERYVLKWRTRLGKETTTQHLDLLVAALLPGEWRFVKFYRSDVHPMPLPLLWISGAENIGLVVTVLATPGGTWGYYEAQRGRHGYLSPCGNAAQAGMQIDRLLRDRAEQRRTPGC